MPGIYKTLNENSKRVVSIAFLNSRRGWISNEAAVKFLYERLEYLHGLNVEEITEVCEEYRSMQARMMERRARKEGSSEQA
jgi:phosphoserine phosphatase